MCNFGFFHANYPNQTIIEGNLVSVWSTISLYPDELTACIDSVVFVQIVNLQEQNVQELYFLPNLQFSRSIQLGWEWSEQVRDDSKLMHVCETFWHCRCLATFRYQVSTTMRQRHDDPWDETPLAVKKSMDCLLYLCGHDPSSGIGIDQVPRLRQFARLMWHWPSCWWFVLAGNLQHKHIHKLYGNGLCGLCK